MPGNTKHHPNSWTPEKLAKLVAMYGEGQSGRQIGREIGMSRNAVIGKCYRLRQAGVLGAVVQKASPPPKPHSSFFGWKKPDAKPKPQARPKPVVCAAPASKTATHLIGIKKNQCKFISEDFRHGDGALQYMCGAAVYKPDASYCGYHHKICVYVETDNQSNKRGRDLERSLRRYT
jgi:hypothetical protein